MSQGVKRGVAPVTATFSYTCTELITVIREQALAESGKHCLDLWHWREMQQIMCEGRGRGTDIVINGT
jgi:hypothetical protein